MAEHRSWWTKWSGMIFAAVAVAVWIALIGGMIEAFGWPGSLSDAGQFGDTFGVLNSLFTGLALAGLVYTALLQQKQLKVQENELQTLIASEDRRQFFDLVRFLTEKRNARKAIYELAREEKEARAWNDDDKEHAAEVCAQFNLAGSLAQQSPILKKLIIESYRRTAVRLHELLELPLEEFRIERGSDYSKEFDWLVDEMRKSAE